jgi:hypothetical protein
MSKWQQFWQLRIPINARNTWYRILHRKITTKQRRHQFQPNIFTPYCQLCRPRRYSRHGHSLTETNQHFLFSYPKFFWYGQHQLFTTLTHLLLIFPFYTTLISSNSAHPSLNPIMYHFRNSHFLPSIHMHFTGHLGCPLPRYFWQHSLRSPYRYCTNPQILSQITPWRIPATWYLDTVLLYPVLLLPSPWRTVVGH